MVKQSRLNQGIAMAQREEESLYSERVLRETSAIQEHDHRTNGHICGNDNHTKTCTNTFQDSPLFSPKSTFTSVLGQILPLQYARLLPYTLPAYATVLQLNPRTRVFENEQAKCRTSKLFAIPHVLNACITDQRRRNQQAKCIRGKKAETKRLARSEFYYQSISAEQLPSQFIRECSKTYA